jgi:transposase
MPELARTCGTALGTEGQHLRHAYEHIDLPPIRPVVTRVRIFGRCCPGCRRRVRGEAPATMPPGSSFGPSVVTMLAYLHHQHAVGYDRLSGLIADLFGLSISEGTTANALRRSSRVLERAGATIVERLRSATVSGCDETGARLITDTRHTRMGWECVLSVTPQFCTVSAPRAAVTPSLTCWRGTGRAAGYRIAGALSRGTAKLIRFVWPTSCATSSMRLMPASRASRLPCAACCTGRSPSAGGGKP